MRTRYVSSHIPILLWRERWRMGVVFVGLAGLGLAFAFSLKTLYPAHSSVLVQLGQEYAYAGRGVATDYQYVVQSEAEIMGSDEVTLRAARRLGVARLAPDRARAFAAATPEKRELMMGRLADDIGRRFKIETAPSSPVIRLSYKDANPQLAALTLNTLLDEYLLYRRVVLIGPTATNDDIRIVEPARPPVTGKSLEAPALVLAILFAGVSAACAGALGALLRPGAPSARSVARALGLPLLGSAGLKPPI